MSNKQYIREKFKAKKETEEKWEKFGDAIGEQIDKDRDYYLKELEITAPRKTRYTIMTNYCHLIGFEENK